MANVNTPFSALPAATALTGAEVLPLDQGGTTKQATVDQVSVATRNNIAANTAFLDVANQWTTLGFQGGMLFVTQPQYVSSNDPATTAYVQSAIRSTMATQPLASITGGTYSFASNGTQGSVTVTAVAGAVTNLAGFASGTGWKVGDLFTITGNGSSRQDAVIRVLTLAGSTPATFEILNGGTGYASAPANFVAPPVLSSFTITLTGTLTSNATFVMPKGTFLTQSDQWIVNNNTTGLFTTTFKISDGTDTATGTGVVVSQGTSNSAATLLQTDGVNDIWLGAPTVLSASIAVFKAAVNFNVGNTDTPIPITLPPGFSRYRISTVVLSGASQTLTTATAGLFTAAAGGGVAVITAATAITVATAAENTINNMQNFTVLNQATSTYNAPTLFWRVANPQGVAATGVVVIWVNFVS